MNAERLAFPSLSSFPRVVSGDPTGLRLTSSESEWPLLKVPFTKGSRQAGFLAWLMTQSSYGNNLLQCRGYRPRLLPDILSDLQGVRAG